jgi:hypothetical protein
MTISLFMGSRSRENVVSKTTAAAKAGSVTIKSAVIFVPSIMTPGGAASPSSDAVIRLTTLEP